MERSETKHLLRCVERSQARLHHSQRLVHGTYDLLRWVQETRRRAPPPLALQVPDPQPVDYRNLAT